MIAGKIKTVRTILAVTIAWASLTPASTLAACWFVYERPAVSRVTAHDVASPFEALDVRMQLLLPGELASPPTLPWYPPYNGAACDRFAFSADAGLAGAYIIPGTDYYSQYQRSMFFQTPSVPGAVCGGRHVIYASYAERFASSDPITGAAVCPSSSLTIKLVPRDTAAESATTLASVEPSKTTNLVAYVYDQRGGSVSSAKVKLQVDVIPNSGGHQHHDAVRNTEHMGKLASGTGAVAQNGKVLTGSTDGGGFTFSFTAPLPAGDHKITASCTDRTCTQQGPDTVWVGIKRLLPIPTASTVYLLENRDTNHPDNHYLTRDAEARLLALADLYRQQFPNDPVLHLNDASLERGGLFDIQYSGRGTTWWTPPHEEHRRGTVIDIRANNQPGATPSKNHKEFKQLASDLGAEAQLHSPGIANQHFHIRLMGVAE